VPDWIAFLMVATRSVSTGAAPAAVLVETAALVFGAGAVVAPPETASEVAPVGAGATSTCVVARGVVTSNCGPDPMPGPDPILDMIQLLGVTSFKTAIVR
jgi:hypothetical protein